MAFTLWKTGELIRRSKLTQSLPFNLFPILGGLFWEKPYFLINEKQIQNERGCDYIGTWGPEIFWGILFLEQQNWGALMYDVKDFLLRKHINEDVFLRTKLT